MTACFTKGLARSLALAALCATALAASAQTLYKLIDKNGKVTYSEEAPKNFDGKVIRIEINPNANTATLPKYQEAPKGGGDGIQRVKPRPAKEAAAPDLEALRKKVADRREALQEAQNNPVEGDVQWIGNAGGGTRAVPTEAYTRRIASLERSLKEAEDELHEAEKQVR